MSEDITKNDLKIYMDSYENMILLHKTVLDQQSEMTKLLTEVVENQNSISSKQMSTCTTLQGITTKLDECSDKLTASGDKLDTTTDKLKDKLSDHHEESIKEHGKIKNRMYVAYGLSATIIIGLLGLLWKFTNIVDILKSVGGS